MQGNVHTSALSFKRGVLLTFEGKNKVVVRAGDELNAGETTLWRNFADLLHLNILKLVVSGNYDV